MKNEIAIENFIAFQRENEAGLLVEMMSLSSSSSSLLTTPLDGHFNAHPSFLPQGLSPLMTTTRDSYDNPVQFSSMSSDSDNYTPRLLLLQLLLLQYSCRPKRGELPKPR